MQAKISPPTLLGGILGDIHAYSNFFSSISYHLYIIASVYNHYSYYYNTPRIHIYFHWPVIAGMCAIMGPYVHAWHCLYQHPHASIQQLLVIFNIYCISSKYHHTLKSCHPRNVAVYFSQLIPINVTLEISPHGTGSTSIYAYKGLQALDVHVCTHMHIQINRLITEAVYTHAC